MKNYELPNKLKQYEKDGNAKMFCIVSADGRGKLVIYGNNDDGCERLPRDIHKNSN